MLKNLKKAAAIVLSFAMAVQFGLADSYYVNAVEEPVEPQQEETKTTTTTPQEQEEVPTTEEETPQQQEEGQQQPAVEEEQPAAEEAQPQPQPVEQAEVKVSYVKEDGTDLMESVTATYDVGYRLDQDTNVFKEAHEAFEFEYAFVNGNKENKITKDQVKASGLTVTSDMTSLTLVYKSTATQNESKDKKVETANLSGEKEDDSDSEDDIATVANNSIELKVGEKATLDSSDVEDWGYNHQHKWTVNKKNIVNLSSKSGSSITVTGEGVGTATVTDTYTYSSFMGGSKRGTKTYTINVTAAVTPTGISISGADTVKQFQTTQLTANLTPEGANGKVTWTSSNEQILSVDENGLVTGNRQGSATITASVQGADKNTLSATKTIEVVKNESPSSGNKREALVYYLKDPTKDANKNGSDQWGPSSLGTAVVNVEGATWTGNKNCFDNVDQRVLSWPIDLNGTNVVPRSNNAWNLIFDAYKASIEKELKVTITKDDVEEITLVPAKISKDNGTTPDMHLDCNVNIKCKSVALVKYWLFDANGTNWDMLGSKNYLVKDESTTQPSDVTSKKFPTTKTVDGVTYTFSGWYTDQSLTNPAPSFPAKVTGAVNYYAKYVAGYQVKYNLAGGQFSDGSTSATEKHNVDTTVVVKEAPTRQGYKFTGWTVEGLEGTTTINSGKSFTMPNGNVTLTANWEKKNIIDYVTLTTKDVTETYNGQSHAAGEATAVANAGKEDEVGEITVEYQKIDGEWTTNREEITARDVSDSKTVNVRVSSDDCVGYVTGTESLTITKRAVTLTSEGGTKPYDGTPLTNDQVTVGGEGFVEGQGATYKVTGSQTLVGSSDNTFKYTLNEGTNADNYVITPKYGTLTVTNRAENERFKITVEANSKTDKYTGKKQSVTGFKKTEFTVNGKTYTVSGLTSKAEGTDSGDYTTAINGTAVVKDADGKDVTKQFNVQTKAGKLSITKRAVTLTSEGGTKPYDGTPLTNDQVTVGGEGFVEGQGATYKVTGSQTLVGSSDNTFKYTLNEGTNADNYVITPKYGTLTVTNRAENERFKITVEANSKTDKYTGKKQSVTGFKKTEFTVNGKTYTVSGLTSKAEGTDSGDYTTAINGTAVVKDADGKDVTKQFNVQTKAGKLSITKRAVTLTSEGGTKPYDGTPLTNDQVTVGGEGFVEGQGATYKVTGSQTLVGSSDNTFKYTLNEGTNADNYVITPKYGTLTVTNRAENERFKITVEANSENVTYDGKEHEAAGFETTEFTVNKQKYTVSGLTTESPKKTNAGTYTNNISGTAVVKDADGKDVTKQFNVQTKARKLSITKRAVTLTSEGGTKPYDGTPLTNDQVTVGGEGFVEGEGASYEVTGTQTEVGNSANSFEYKLNEKTLASNYNITKVVGTLTITAAPAPVTPATPSTPSTPSTPRTPSTTPRTPSAPQVTTPVETVEKETTPKAEPKKEEKVEEEYTPKASPQYYWALINLICAILTVLFGLLLLISKRHKSEDDDEEDDDETKQQTNDDDESKEQEKKRGLFTRVLAVLIAIVSVVFFLVTEDLSLPWTWTDQWTIWMVVIGLVQIVVFFVGRKWKNVDDDEDEEEAQQA